MSDTAAPNSGDTRVPKGVRNRLILVSIVLVCGAIGYFQFREALSLQNLAEQESGLRQFQQARPLLVYGVAFAVYVLVTGLSLPLAGGMSLVYGWYFGLIRGVILASFASTAGATLAFLLSRYLLQETLNRRFGDRLANFNDALKREGPYYLFTLRLIPAVPFFVINVVMGLTPIRTFTFWWVSQLGMLPFTVVYIYAGSRVPTLSTLADHGVAATFSPVQLAQLTVAFALLGLFPMALRLLIKRNK